MDKYTEEQRLLALNTPSPGNNSNPLDAIFNAYPDDYFCLDSEGRILDYRIGNLAALYLSPEKLSGLFLKDVLPAEAGEKLLAGMHQVIQNQKVGFVEYRSHISEKEHWFEARLAALANNQVVVVIREMTERVQLSARIQRQVQQLSALRTIDAAITASFDIKIPLAIILQQTINQLGVDAANVRLLNPLSHMLEYAAGQGFWTDSLQNSSVMIGHGFAGEAALRRRLIKVTDLKRHPAEILGSTSLTEEGFCSYFAIPLIAKGDVKGVLEIYHRSPLNPGDDWLEFLDMLASQAAVAIESATLFQSFQRANTELTLAYDAVIESWSQALELSGRETKEHTSRVARLATELAIAIGMEEKDLQQVQRGAKLHDIGKLCIPESILQKPGPLTEEEWKIVRQLPRFAYQLLSPIKYLATALDIPHYHLEKWDGSGYPDGLHGDQIPEMARLFSIVHVYDALTTSHPYQAARTKDQALEQIIGLAGKQFDPAIVKIFVKLMNATRNAE